MNIIKIFMNKDKLKTYAMLASNIVVFSLAFFLSILMTHYCKVEDYGKYRYATQFVLTIPALFCMGIDQSCGRLVAIKDSEDRSGIIGMSLLITTLLSLIVIVGLYVATIIPGIKVFVAESVYIVIPFVTVFMIQTVINMVYQGTGEAYKLAIFNVLPQILMIIGTAIMIVVNKAISFSEAIYIYLISNTVSIIPKILETKFSMVNIKRSFIELKNETYDNGFKVYLSTVFQRSATQIVGLICGGVYGFSEYGYYALALSMAGSFRLISSSMAMVKYRDNVNKAKIEKEDLLFLLISNIILLIVFLLLIDTVFYWFFPKNYELAVSYLKVLGIAYVFWGISDYFLKFLIAKKCGRIVMINASITGISFIILSFILVTYVGMMGLVIATFLDAVIDLLQSVFRYIQFVTVKKGGVHNEI